MTKFIYCSNTNQVLTEADLKPDPALKRRIEGIQQRQMREQEDSDVEDNRESHQRPQVVHSDEDEETPRQSLLRGIKEERQSTVIDTPGTLQENMRDESRSSSHQGSIVNVDMEGDDNEQEEEDDGNDNDLYE